MAVYDLERIRVPAAPPGYADDTADVHYVPAPCQVACPVGTDAPSYIGYIWERQYEKAFEAITATNPFSSICGRVCDAPCEPACRRTESDGPLQIRNLKRFVMDRLGAEWMPPPAAPVTRAETVAVVGAGPCGLTAAHDLCVAGFEVHVYEMSDRPGGMMVWGIPAFRLPHGVIEQDIGRLERRFPGLHIHLNTGLGPDLTLDTLKARHAAVLLTIGAWWGKPLGVPGETHERVVDGVGFLRRVNGGERPRLPATVVVIGGGDVAMDACRVARRLPGCEHIRVVYRRGPDEIPARRVEFEGALAEGIEFVYHTQQLAVASADDGLVLRCVRTEPGAPDADGRRRPVPVTGSEHDIECGLLIAAVGQTGRCAELDRHGLMSDDRVNATWAGMRTADSKVFAAGDGAFGGSTIVMAMHHGQRAAYYVRAFLDGHDDPLPYRTPYRTRRLPVAQDTMWERLAPHTAKFFGLGENPAAFPEIEATYDTDTAVAEAARCYRCDAETGSPDYSVQHREDIFSMARTHPLDHDKLQAMLQRRLRPRANPFPERRPATLDDLVFLPANLSRLVIDPYREACNVATDLGGKLRFEHPFVITGFDEAPAEVREALATGLARSTTPYLGRRPLGPGVEWLQRIPAGAADTPDPAAAATVWDITERFSPPPLDRAAATRLRGLGVAHRAVLDQALPFALERGLDFLLLDATGGYGAWPELAGAPDLTLLRDALAILRRLRREEAIDLVYFGGVRSGTDAAKLVGLGAKLTVLGVTAGFAAGGALDDGVLLFSADHAAVDRAQAVTHIVQASVAEASMMARCVGKTNLHNVEPEDLRAVTIAAAAATGIPLVGRAASAAATA